jgi:hypothetical protein
LSGFLGYTTTAVTVPVRVPMTVVGGVAVFYSAAGITSQATIEWRKKTEESNVAFSS